MILHVLPGDSYRETFRETGIFGDVAVCRECLIEGPIKADSLQEFWTLREQFLTKVYPESESIYRKDVVAGFGKIIDLPADSEVNLWFEYELFCQANMWFCLDLLRDSNAKIYRVEPVLRNTDDIWKGFGSMDATDLKKCFNARKMLSPDDIKFGSNLWNAYSIGDHAALKLLSAYDSLCFPYLKEVCEAAIEKDIQPQKILKEITNGGEVDFNKIFMEFSKRAGVYGFGDTQLKRIMENV